MAAYAELHAHSYFSFLDATSSPEVLVQRAVEIGIHTLALTDHNGIYGAVRFVRAARRAGVHPILGAELTLVGGYHLTLLVANATGWANLCWLISRAHVHTPKGQALLPLEELSGHTQGLIALSGCRRGQVGTALLQGDRKGARAAVAWLREQFSPECVFIELQHHHLPEDRRLIAEGVALAESLGVGVVATNNVHYTRHEEYQLQDVMVCIRHNVSLIHSARVRRPNSEYYLKSPAQMASLFAAYPEAIRTTCDIAERCQFALDEPLQELPLFPVPEGWRSTEYLRWLCEHSVRERYGTAARPVLEQLEHELGVIERQNLTNYFLIVWDLMRFAREQGILAQGRGSACNSLVAYVLGISPIDPLQHDLVFERFLSDERPAVPDIDIDFDSVRREEVIQYIYRTYGQAHVAMACTFSCYRVKGAVRDVGKVLGIPPRLLTQAITNVDGDSGAALGRSEALQRLAQEAPIWHQLLTLVERITDVPRHLGLHNGGMILSRAPLTTRIAIEPAAMPGRTVVQFDKDELEDADVVKIDVLGLRMLSAIGEAVEIIKATTGKQINLHQLGFKDKRVYRMIAAADTIGVFQTESRAQQQVLPRLKPTCFNDLVISISLIRPGPIIGNMVHPYLRRRRGEEMVTYAHPLLKPALEETLGVVLFQEQVLKVARDLAGFTPGQGEMLRRALGKKNAGEAVEQVRAVFVRGARRKGVGEQAIEEVWEQLQAFASYSFAKSHAAAFAVLVYWSAWLKHYYHAAFSCALLNNQPMGFWSAGVLVNDAKRHSVRVLPVSVNHSEVRCTVIGDALRIGLSFVDGLGEVGSLRVVEARGKRLFTNLLDFCRRTQLPRRLVEHLICAGAFDDWRQSRRQLLWQLGTLQYAEAEFEMEFPTEGVILPPLSALAAQGWEQAMTGVTVGEHLLTFYRPWLKAHGVYSSRDIARAPSRRSVWVAGKVEVHQSPPTAHGVHFIDLEDEFGHLNVVVKPNVYQEFRKVWRLEPLLLVQGTIQRKGEVVNVVAQCAVPLQTE